MGIYVTAVWKDQNSSDLINYIYRARVCVFVCVFLMLVYARIIYVSCSNVLAVVDRFNLQYVRPLRLARYRPRVTIFISGALPERVIWCYFHQFKYLVLNYNMV